jgi:hypothetical protein
LPTSELRTWHLALVSAQQLFSPALRLFLERLSALAPYRALLLGQPFRFSSPLFERLFPLNARRFTLSSTRLSRFDDLQARFFTRRVRSGLSARAATRNFSSIAALAFADAACRSRKLEL